MVKPRLWMKEATRPMKIPRGIEMCEFLSLAVAGRCMVSEKWVWPNKEVRTIDMIIMMDTETRVRNLLSKPFGPFRDSLVLEKKCNTTAKESVVLTSLMMECGGEAIGCVSHVWLHIAI
jgi:hypothetical protein